MPCQMELPGKFSRQRSGQQYVVGLFHNQPCCDYRMEEAFQGGDRACPQTGSFHNRGVHSLDAVQLPFGATTGIEEAGLFKHLDGPFDGLESRPSLPENRMTGSQRLGKARGLARRHCTPAGAAVSEDQETRMGQLRRRSLAC